MNKRFKIMIVGIFILGLLSIVLISSFDYKKVKTLREERDAGRIEILKAYKNGDISKEEAIKQIEDLSEHIALKSGVKIVRKRSN